MLPEPSLLAAASACLPQFLDDLAHIVNIDSGTHNRAGVNRVADLVVARLRALGCQVQREPSAAAGDLVIGRLSGTGHRQVVLLAHLDTVFEDGTASRRPFAIGSDGRARGPGVTDDKAGVLAAIYALGILIECGLPMPAEVIVCLSPDEEVGSPTARARIEALASAADVVLSLECAREDGALVQARKGIADVEIRLTGRAAHAGIEPERGADAARAAARLTLALCELADRTPEVSINVGLLRAGSRVNVVSEHAVVGLEARAPDGPTLTRVLDRIGQLAARSGTNGITADATVSALCPPWPRQPATEALVRLAAEVGREVGIEIRASATGGVADANYAAATGTATLDGLGPVGGGDHSADEWLDTTSIAPRTALLAGMLTRLATDPAAIRTELCS